MTTPPPSAFRTLAIDIGGSGVKMMVLDPAGDPVNERLREKTPSPAAPDAVLEVIRRMVDHQPVFDRVSVGFPGVVVDGVIRTAPNLGTALWCGRDLRQAIETITHAPTRVINDADMQGYGAIGGRGVELTLTLGTGLGSALFVEGKLVPNLELGHHPFRKGKTYEERVSGKERKRIGDERWSRRVRQVIYTLGPIFNYDVLYLGGGNSRKISVTMPDNVKIVDNRSGLLGGIRLWR